MNVRRFVNATWVSCFLGAMGCGAADDGKTSAASTDISAISLQGEWRLLATGEAYGCQVEQEGRWEFEPKPFRVDARLEGPPAPSTPGAEANAFARRVQYAEVSFTSNISDDVEFEGGGFRDGQVYFTIRETLSNGDLAVYDFEGAMRDTDRATGTATGSIPGGCKVRGDFTLRRQ